MHISVEHGDNFATLHLRGEFDTYYCKKLQEEIDALANGGIVHVVLNLRLVKFINSTALGAIIKASKSLAAREGRLVLSRPSTFCRDIIEKVGLDRVVPIFDSDEDAAAGLFASKAKTAKAGERSQDDDSSVLFTPLDETRLEHFIRATPRGKAVPPSNWTGVARMSSLDETGVRFVWLGGDTGLEPFAMGQLLAIGTDLKVKFRLPLFKHGYCEAVATVSEVEERNAGVKIGATFTEIDEKTLGAVRQYAADLKFLKDELKKATGK